MLKMNELTDPNSCMNRALDDEVIFVLLCRDEAAPVAIRAWIAERIRLGKNTPEDKQIIEAERCAARMDAEREEVRCSLCVDHVLAKNAELYRRLAQ